MEVMKEVLVMVLVMRQAQDGVDEIEIPLDDALTMDRSRRHEDVTVRGRRR